MGQTASPARGERRRPGRRTGDPLLTALSPDPRPNLSALSPVGREPAGAPRANTRDAQREASRQRVLDAARELFAEFGYASTTVRMIADRANLSVGGVFTTFEDKADILHHVRMGQNARLRERLAEMAPTLNGPVRERVSRLLTLAYAEEWPNLPLVVAYVGASHGWSGVTEAAMSADHAVVWDALRSVIADGAARGDLRSEVDAALAVEVIYGIYLGQYRRAWYGGWTAQRTAEHLDRKLQLVFAGLEAESGAPDGACR